LAVLLAAEPRIALIEVDLAIDPVDEELRIFRHDTASVADLHVDGAGVGEAN